MAETKKKTSKQKMKMTSEKLISHYMNAVLENGESPRSIYKFAKDHQFKEADFYKYFGSFEALKQGVWNQFFTKSTALMDKAPEVANFNSRDKLLTFYFTFFELLTANRSYVLFALHEEAIPPKNLVQLKGLRKHIKSFATALIKDDNAGKNNRFLKKNESLFSEGVWFQTMFLLKFWMDDSSADFEKTDIAIEKSVNTAYDVFDNTPLERVFDFGKFLWQEKMA